MTRYLWDNYIYPNDAEYLFFLGIGDAYNGLMNLLNLDENITDSTDFIYSFIADNTLQSVRKSTDDGLVSDWYRKHSMVFVSEDHACWDPSRQRKNMKKYGALVRSPTTNLNEMLMEHKGEVFGHLLQQTTLWREEQDKEKAKSRVSTSATAGDSLGMGLGLLPPAVQPEDVTGLDGSSNGNGNGKLRGGNLTATPNPGGNSGRRSPTKLPPIGTFEVTSPLRSPSKRPPFP